MPRHDYTPNAKSQTATPVICNRSLRGSTIRIVTDCLNLNHKCRSFSQSLQDIREQNFDTDDG